MFTTTKNRRRSQHPTGFTLVELMVVTTIIAILATTMLFALAGATEAAKRRRAATQIARIHELIAEKWESYETRSVNPAPIAVAIAKNQFGSEADSPRKARKVRNLARLLALRELMRIEMPDRVTDVDIAYGGSGSTPITTPVMNKAIPSLHKFYRSRATAGWTPVHQGAECLYLILSRIELGDGFAIDSFPDGEIGDTDNDGMREILDAWGEPMQFIRWPAGYDQPSTYQDVSMPAETSDAFDFTGIFTDTYVIFPLVFSKGPDKSANIFRDGNAFSSDDGYSSTMPTPNDPYFVTGIDQDGDGTEDVKAKIGSVLNPTSGDHLDNITNHALGLSN